MSVFDYFPDNWSEGVAVETSWLNTVQQASLTGDEERVVLVDRPTRLIQPKWTGMSRAESQRIFYALMRAGTDEVAVPLYSDQSETTAESSGDTINCPTATRRFYVGYRVVIVSPTGAWQERVIEALAAGVITTTVALVGTFPIGSKVFPLIDALVELESEVTFQNDVIGESSPSFLEVTDVRTLPASAVDVLPDGVSEIELPADQVSPVFPARVQWSTPVSLRPLRQGERYTRGRGTNVYTRGTRPLVGIALEVLATNREEAWKQIQFFDYTRASAVPFWLKAPTTLLKAIAFNVGYVDVEQSGNLDDVQEFVRQVAITKLDESVEFAIVDNITIVGDVWRIAFVTPIASVANAVDAMPAWLVRFSGDAQSEEWLTDAICRFNLSMQEVVAYEENIDVESEAL